MYTDTMKKNPLIKTIALLNHKLTQTYKLF